MNLGISPSVIWQRFLHEEAFGTWQEIIDDLRARVGDEAAATFQNTMDSHWNARRGMPVASGVDYEAEPALMALPAPFFLTAIEYALVSQHGPVGFRVVEEINSALNKVGASYRFDWSGRADWHGDTGIQNAVVQPALAALADPRLTGCASEYHAALNHMRAGTAKDLEDVIEESGKAVESAIKVALIERGIKLKGNETAFPLFKLVVDNGICPPEAENAVLGVARIRNNLGAHGTGSQPRVLPPGVSELAVNSAAIAIKYLAGLLP
jgi:hypothetical protein